MSDKIESYCRLCAESRLETEMLSLDKDILDHSEVPTRKETYVIKVKNCNCDHKTLGKLDDENWQDFQNLKRESKIMNTNDKMSILFNKDRNVKFIENQLEIKLEPDSDRDNDNLSTDSDVPLKQSVTKKCSRFSLKGSLDIHINNTFVNSNQIEVKLESNNFRGYNDLDQLSANSDVQFQNKYDPTQLKRSNENHTLNAPWDSRAYKYTTCDEEYSSILQLQQHSLKIHSFCCVFKCIQCSKVSPHYLSFVKHARTHNKTLKRCCEFCNRPFKNNSDLTSHKIELHKTVFKTKCSNCGMNFKTPEKLQEHWNLFNKSAKDRMEHMCNYCNKAFTSRTSLLNHMKIHTNRSKDFACHICEKSFYSKFTLNVHLVVHNESRKMFKCDHCLLVFRTKGNLLSHQSLHTGMRPFVCEECGKTFRVKSNLVSHSTVHTKLRHYCERCNQPFKSKEILRRHLKLKTCTNTHKKNRVK